MKLRYLFVLAMLLSGCKTFDSSGYFSNLGNGTILRSVPAVPYYSIGEILLPITIVCAVLSIIFGLFVFTDAPAAIKAQIKFYKKINWRVAPISMKKEVRNAKIIGLFLFAIGVVTIIYIKFFLK